MLQTFKVVHNLDNSHRLNNKNSAKYFGFNPTLCPRLENILQTVESPEKTFFKTIITQEELLNKYGNYDKAYTAYQEIYNIKCKRGWRYFLKAIEGLSPPISLEERVEKLEETVKFLAEILVENQR